MNPAYTRTVQLLLDIAPAVFDGSTFAMKGGTALNLFVQDMPRLSVDIDIAFTPHRLERESALRAIADQLQRACARVQRLGHQVEVRKDREGAEARMFIRNGDVEVKVEVNFVFRGTVLPPQQRPLVPAAQSLFSANIEVPVLDTAELYGSKLVAALDRQHPRDLFDVQLMLAARGWDETLLDCFVVYLAGHNRPAHEVLFPRAKPLAAIFAAEFAGMTSAPAHLDDLVATRTRMLDELPRALLPRHRQFLLSLLRCEPDWTLMPYPHLEQLPALQWKLQNLARLRKNPGKFRQQHDELAARWEIAPR